MIKPSSNPTFFNWNVDGYNGTIQPVLIGSSSWSKISNFITQIYNLQEINYFEEIIKHTFQDKKNVNQKIRTCVLNGIGNCEYDIEINPNLILDSLEYYNKIL